ncbi:MAG: PAS domain S-box protein [Isosphaeraceae bacterium]|nr:PAS domain S-box protein [Isosphaeraceae bacterium]
MSDASERKLTIWFGIALVLLIVNAVFSSWNIRNLVATSDRVVHTREVLGALDGVVSTLREAESGQRGYVITGQEKYVERLDEIVRESTDGLANLRRLVSDSAEQRSSVDGLDRAVRARLAVLRANLAIRRAQGFDAARRAIVDGQGKQDMDQVDRLAAEIKGRERLLLEQRTGVAVSSIWSTIGTFSLATILALGLLGSAYYLVRRDAADRKRSEQAVRRSEVRKAAILESALDAIVTIDHDGNVIEFNPAAERTFGYAREDALGRELAALIIPPALRDRHREGLRHYAASGAGAMLGRRIELPALRADGSEFPVELAISPIALDGPPMFTAYLRDITERKRDEAAVEERERLANLGADVGAALIEGESLPDMLQLCCEALVRHLHGAFARIWTLDDPQELLVLQASAGIYTHTDGPHGRVPIGKFKIGQIAQERRPHLTNDVIGDPRVSEQEWAQREGMVAFAGYPLLVGGRLVGVVAMFARHKLSRAAFQAMGTAASGIALGIERKHAEAAIREGSERVRLLLESTGEGIFGLDLDGRCSFCNPAGLKILGYADASELVGKNMHAAIHHSLPDGTPCPEAECPIYSAFRAGRQAFSDDEYLWRADGTGFPAELRCAPIRRGEEILGAVVTFVDISRRRRVEETMRLRDRALRSIVQGVFITDPSRADEPIIYVNAAFEQITGYAQGEVSGHDIRFLQGPGTEPEALKAIRLAFRERRDAAVELLCYRKDGAEFWASLSLAPVVDTRGRVSHFVGLITDVTERKRGEEELREAKDRAEAASRSKSTFLANMSHELRTPLNAIIGYSEMLHEEAEEEGREEAASDLKKIQASGRHLLGLINDILDLSKIEAGKMDLFLETFEVPEMIRGVLGTIAPLVEQNGNTLEVDCPNDLGEMHADLTKVRQVLLNLLSNASKFTDHGTIALRVSREKLEGKDWMAFEVTDSGIGMTPDQLAKLFQPFTQADASTTRKYGGTGLGLTITRRFCQLMGGDITVKSDPGRGSTFTVKLPAQSVEPVPTPAAGDPVSADFTAAPGSLVLVIDDDLMVHDLLRRTLSKDGFRVQCAAGGKEGLRLAREIRPDVITLDVMMPGMDGWAVLSALKSDPELADTPVVMVTMIDDKNLGYTLGASDYLTKPVDRVRLAAILKKHRQQCAGNCWALVVEDDVVSRRMVCEMLEKDGWTVVAAENGRVALERVREHRPHLILLDLMMPEMDGFAFMEELRGHEEWSDIPTLVLTAKDLTEDDRQRLNGDVLGFLQKGSCTREELLRQIQRAVSAQTRQGAGAGSSAGASS